MTAFALLLLALPAIGPADRIVAVVGETPVLESELVQAADFYRMATLDTITPDSALRGEVLDQLIDNLLLQEQARLDTVNVTREEIDEAVDENIASMRERFEDADQFRAALAAEGLTERDLRSRYENDVQRKLLSQRLMEREGLTKVYISPAEAERFYEANRDSIALVPGRVELAHLLVAIKPSDAAEAEGQRRAAEVLDILGRGGDFATVAGSFSDDRATAGRGGDWGWHDLTDLPLDLALVLNQLEPGQVAPPFRTLEGYIILRLDSREGDRVRFRSILLRVPLTRGDTARARQRANNLRERVLGGVPFDSLARQFSDDPVTADSGGRLGEFLIAGLTPPFDSVVAGLDSGEVSEPVLSEHGFHLVHVLAKQDERMMTYLEMQDVIRNYLYGQKTQAKLEDYLKRISENVYVKRYD
jgi:peptidyl-prolyl cis-trans isomerase SurA